jgi:3(or 17)beta-hydroxysteroid dehydrogenase
VIEEIERRFGYLHILVNNAGIVGPSDIKTPESTRLEDWHRIFAVNVESVFLGCRAAIPALRRAGTGSIINISSIAALLATPSSTAYGASKAAVRQLTKSVAQYCVQEKMNIRCNSVHPGNVRTPLWEQQAAEWAQKRAVSVEDIFAELRAIVPMGDMTLPEDVAAAVSFLASNDSRHLTGAKIVVDGGIVHCDTYHVHQSTLSSRA